MTTTSRDDIKFSDRRSYIDRRGFADDDYSGIERRIAGWITIYPSQRQSFANFFRTCICLERNLKSALIHGQPLYDILPESCMKIDENLSVDSCKIQVLRLICSVIALLSGLFFVVFG